MALTASGWRAGKELGVPVTEGRADLGKLRRSAHPNHDDQDSHHRNRRRGVQRDAERTVIGVGLGHMIVRHLHSDQQHQQRQTQQSSSPESSWLPAATLAKIWLQCAQTNNPCLKDTQD